MPYSVIIGAILSGLVAYLMRDAKYIREHVNELESELLSEDNEVLRTKLAEITGMNNMSLTMPKPPQSLAEPDVEDQALYMNTLKKLTQEIGQSIGEVYRLSGQIMEKARQLPTRQVYALLTAAPPILVYTAASLFDMARRLHEPLVSIDSFIIAMLVSMTLLVVAIAYRSEELRKEVCELLFRRAKLVYTALEAGKPHEVPSYSRFCGAASRAGDRGGEPGPLSR